MSRRGTLWLALLLLGGAATAVAHEVRPAYLELRQTGPETHEVLWKVPAQGELRLSLHARLPENCHPTAEGVRFAAAGSYVERSTILCSGGLNGRVIGVDGLKATLTDVLVRVVRIDGSAQVVRLKPSEPSFVVEAAPSRLQVAATYLRLGVEHIFSGIDHLLFVLALLILVENRRRLVATVSAFTVAHSLTLAGATLGLVRVPPRPVEASIALSIVFVAYEIVRLRQGHPGLTARAPWVVAFVFGLLHGFGFAGALSQIGLPPQAIPLALLCFNLGVEAGQLAFIGAVLVAMAAASRLAVSWPRWAWQVPVYCIGALASFWTLDRVLSFWR